MVRTVAEALERADPKLREMSDSPRADAQLLLGEALGKPRSWILAHPEYEIERREQVHFDTMLSKIAEGMALPHVLGWWEFYGRRFLLDQSVLIPRPETELMIETALRLSTPKPQVLDIGTGSGCIAVTLALELEQPRVLATDISFEALRVASENVRHHEAADRVDLVCTDLTTGIRSHFDVICANLPYVASNQLDSLGVASREPHQALDGGSEGTELIRRSLDALPELLGKKAIALFEIDPDQASTVLEWAMVLLPSADVWTEDDLAGRQRLLVIRHE